MSSLLASSTAGANFSASTASVAELDKAEEYVLELLEVAGQTLLTLSNADEATNVREDLARLSDTYLRLLHSISKTVAHAINTTNEYSPMHNNSYSARCDAHLAAMKVSLVRQHLAASSATASGDGTNGTNDTGNDNNNDDDAMRS